MVTGSTRELGDKGSSGWCSPWAGWCAMRVRIMVIGFAWVTPWNSHNHTQRLGIAFRVFFPLTQTKFRGRESELVRKPQGYRLFLFCPPTLTPSLRWMLELQPSSPDSRQAAGGREGGSLLRSLRSPRNRIQRCCIHFVGQALVVRPHLSARKTGECSLLPLQVQLAFCDQGRRRKWTLGRQSAVPAPGRYLFFFFIPILQIWKLRAQRG